MVLWGKTLFALITSMAQSLLLVLVIVPAAVSATNAAGQTFLESNKLKAGVVTLSSGLQYKVLESGSGREHPLSSTTCSCHYEGRTAQEFSKSPPGRTFDSSFARGEPTSFAPNQVIAGWTEAMQLMVAGDKWELYLPSELAYGESGAGDDIGPGDTLIFTLQLISLSGPGRAITVEEAAARDSHATGRGGMGGRGAGKRRGKTAKDVEKSDHELR